MNTIIHGIRIFGLFAALVVTVAGCAEPPHSSAMIVGATPARVTAPHSVKVAPVTGGKQTDAWDRSSLGNAEFQEALVTSLTNSRLFQHVTVLEPAEWTLRTAIISQEMRGVYHNTAELMVRYDLIDTSDHSLWGDTVYTSNEMGPGDIFSGFERARVLIENTARENISNALERLQRWFEKMPS